MGSCCSALGWAGLPCQVTWPTRMRGGRLVGVLVGVLVGTGESVTVGVLVAHAGWVKTISNPLLNSPLLHEYWVEFEPEPLCSPTVAEFPVPLSVPYTKSMREMLSYRRISKFTDTAGA